MLGSMDGSGTEQDPYRITNLEKLRAVSNDLSAHYELANDINAREPSSSGFNPIGDYDRSFNGTFDGNDFEIRNLYINQPDLYRVGLFGCVGGKGRIENIGLASADVTGEKCTGGLIGLNHGVVESSYLVESDVSGHRGIGGLVGWDCKKIKSSYTAKVDVSGDKHVGGLVGWNRGIVESSYVSEADVSGDKNVGGLVGWNTEIVASSHVAEADVSGDKYIGGLVGNNSKKIETSLVLSSTDSNPNILEDADLVLSRGNHRISYVVETKTLYLQINNKIYSNRGVSPIELQSLLEGAEVLKMTEIFMASVVTAT